MALYFHQREIFEADDTGYVLNDSHGDGHEGKQHGLVPEGTGDQMPGFHLGQQEEDAQAEAVERDIGAGAESGVDPLFAVVDDVAEQQLDDPSAQ